ncbi:hypothetical protein MMC06_004138 [Schaereria dolodes]|nr:hypothetical protein [Schaereria dolodes]
MQLVYLFFYQLLTCLAAAQGDSTDGFDSPPDGTGAYNITEGSSFQIEWHTELTFVALTLWHDGSNDYEYLSGNITSKGIYTWLPVTSKYNISNNTFFFLVYNPGDTAPTFGSRQFNLTAALSSSSSTTTTMSTTATISSSSSSTAGPVTTSAIPAASSPTTSVLPSSSTGLSSSAKTGLGVGIGVGVPLLIALGVFAGWRLRSGHGRQADTAREGYSAVDKPSEGVAHQRQQQQIYVPTYELQDTTSGPELGTGLAHEMASNPRR